MPRITFTARPINAPQDSRTGGRRTLRDKQGPVFFVGRPGPLGRGRDNQPRRFPVVPFYFAALVAIAIASSAAHRIF
ncbi:hypothetical protein [Defluviimonas sp. SAOS-178_SWC]|uniref:hypothetical protein n=1 Tax=Defluviimonas sp. SAOS-178_SWC TaxID=3121287 RepID=UPI00322220BB